jgi:hypothetical protein
MGFNRRFNRPPGQEGEAPEEPGRAGSTGEALLRNQASTDPEGEEEEATSRR